MAAKGGRPVPAYPANYAPGGLRLELDVCFESRSDGAYHLPDDPVVSGTCGTWLFSFANHDHDLHAGAVITLVRFDCQFAFELNTTRPLGRDYCTLESASGAQLSLRAGRGSVNLFSVVVEEGVFRQGDSCTVRLGDRRQGSVGSEVFWTATTGQFLVAVDATGKGSFTGTRQNPVDFRVVAHPEPRLLRLLGPTCAAVGEEFAVHLGVFDRNRNPVDSPVGEITFDAPAGVRGLPPSCRLSAAEGGLRTIGGISIDKPGAYRIGVSGAAGSFYGNPIVVSDAPSSYVYWGDVHAHAWGDSTMHLMHLRSEKLDPLQRHRQGRDIGRFDFACPASMSMDPERREEIWEAYREACASMDEPGVYVPFLAYEAHPEAGDRQMIFRDFTDEPKPPDMRLPMGELDDFYGHRDDVLLQVHIGGAPPRWDLYRPERERLLEVCSGFGCAEWLLQKALQLGYRPSVCGASDLHLGFMGGPRAVETFRGRFGQKYPMNQRDSSYGTGPLTAIFASHLDRNQLWEAIQTGQTYATSGARIYLQVTCNGQRAGGEIQLGDEGLTVDMRIHACASIRRVDVIVGAFRVHSWAIARPDQLDFSESLTLEREQLPGEWLYVRVEQVDGEYAWSTPVWFEKPAAAASGDLPAWNDEEEVVSRGDEGKGKAAGFLPELMRYLEIEEQIDRFRDIAPMEVAQLSVGRCAVFHCRWGEEEYPMTIRWFFEFEIPKIRFDLGWRDYGAFDENDLGPVLMKKYG